MSPASQLTFDLGQRPALNREDFLVAPSNELAVALIDRWPDWPVPTVVLCGPAGSGKTHLSEVWRRASAALTIDLASLGESGLRDLSEQGEAVLAEDVDRILASDPGRAEPLFHLYNLLREGGRDFMMTGSAPPQSWAVTLADLRSRLGAAMVVELGPPDDALIGAVLVKLFADRQLRIGPEVLRYLLPRMERSFAAARDLVAAIDQMALAKRRDITVALAREALEHFPTGEEELGLGAEGRDQDLGKADDSG